MDWEQAREAATRAGLELVPTPDGLVLSDGTMRLRADLSARAPRLRPGVLQHELLVRAARLKHAGEHPVAVDATAGLGDDSLLLAAAGFRVLLFERNPVAAALLADALARAREAGSPACAARMELVAGDSIEALPHLGFQPDVVLLDPMFPAKRADARAKKKLQLLQRLEAPCDDEAELLDAAFAAQPRKVVVKRPLRGPWLAGRKPSYSIEGKTVRYDCLLVPARA